MLVFLLLISLSREISVANFAYGLKLLGERRYDRAVYLIKSGLDTSFKQWTLYYMARAYLQMGDILTAQRYLMRINSEFLWYDYVLQSLSFISWRQGNRSACENLNIPPRAVPEFYEMLFECIEKKIISIKERGGEAKETGKLRERLRDILYLLMKNSLQPVDFLDYSDFFFSKSDLMSIRAFGQVARTVISSEQREEISSILMDIGRPQDAIRWTTDPFMQTRAYFALGDYKKAFEMSEKYLGREEDMRRKETLAYIRLVSYARANTDEDEKFEEMAWYYIKNFASERFAGELALRLGVKSYINGKKDKSVVFISSAVESPYADISERARFILKHNFGYDLEVSPRGFLFLISQYKKGLVNLKPSPYPASVFVNKYSDADKEEPRALELYYLKIYMGASRLSPIVSLILKDMGLEQDQFLMSKGFIKFPSSDFRSTFPVYEPPPIAFFEELKSASEKWNVPLSLVMSMALVESHFNPAAVSPSYAIGLMQIIPSTAREIFSEISIPFTTDFLFDPKINSFAGVYYIAKLKKFFGSYALAVAGYNAGPQAVIKWLKSWRDVYCNDIHLFIENIPYRQTRYYTMLVLSYMLEYARLLGEEINLKELFRCPNPEPEGNTKW